MQVATGRAQRQRRRRSWRMSGVTLWSVVARASLRGPAFALTALAVGLLFAVAHPERTPAQLRLVDEGSSVRVTAVAVGSHAWSLGVRPGMSGTRWEGEAAGADIDAGDRAVGVALSVPPGGPLELTGAAVLFLAGLLLPVVGLPGRGLLLTLATTASVWPLFERVGLPWAYPLALLPPVTGLASTGWLASTRRRLAGTGVVAAMLFVLVLANMAGDAPWPLLWALPPLVGIGSVLAEPVWSLTLAIVSGSRGARRPDLLREGLRDAASELVPLARVNRLAGRDDERARVATRIHNDVLPELVVSLRALELDRADDARTTLAKLDDDLRHMMLDRHGRALTTEGLVAAVEGLAASTASRYVPVSLVVTADAGRPPGDVETAVFQIAQEALQNAARHSGADLVRVRLGVSDRSIELAVSDDGVGIGSHAARDAVRRGHVGLVDMRARAAAIGGELVVRSLPGSGTEVRLRWKA